MNLSGVLGDAESCFLLHCNSQKTPSAAESLQPRSGQVSSVGEDSIRNQPRIFRVAGRQFDQALTHR